MKVAGLDSGDGEQSTIGGVRESDGDDEEHDADPDGTEAASCLLKFFGAKDREQSDLVGVESTDRRIQQLGTEKHHEESGEVEAPASSGPTAPRQTARSAQRRPLIEEL